MGGLFKKLDTFKNEVDNMQHYQKKMMMNLTEVHLETKTVSERLSLVSNLNMDELIGFKD